MAQDNSEFKIALREVAVHAPKLRNPYGINVYIYY